MQAEKIMLIISNRWKIEKHRHKDKQACSLLIRIQLTNNKIIKALCTRFDPEFSVTGIVFSVNPVQFKNKNYGYT